MFSISRERKRIRVSNQRSIPQSPPLTARRRALGSRNSITDKSRVLCPHTSAGEKPTAPPPSAADGLDCLAVALREKPAVIVLDILFPKTDGFAILKDLKAEPRTRAILVIVLSNFEGQEEACAGLGAYRCLLKTDATLSEVVALVGEAAAS